MDGAKGKLIAEMEELLSYPIFIKPVNMGSSVGISKVKTRGELEEAVENALLYDTKILAEQLTAEKLSVRYSVIFTQRPARREKSSLRGNFMIMNQNIWMAMPAVL